MSEHNGKEVKIKVIQGAANKGKEEKGLPQSHDENQGSGSHRGEANKRDKVTEEETGKTRLEEMRQELAANRDTVKGAAEMLDLIDRTLSESPERQSLPTVLLERWIETQRESAENRDGWLRAAAELENFKKRTVQEKSRLLKYGNEQLLRDLLPVVDNLDRALTHSENAVVSETFVNGITLIAGMLKDVLERYGVREIKALDEPFDPSVHEAIARAPESGKGPNVVVQELEKGFMYHDRLLRPARVVVSE